MADMIRLFSSETRNNPIKNRRSRNHSFQVFCGQISWNVPVVHARVRILVVFLCIKFHFSGCYEVASYWFIFCARVFYEGRSDDVSITRILRSTWSRGYNPDKTRSPLLFSQGMLLTRHLSTATDSMPTRHVKLTLATAMHYTYINTASFLRTPIYNLHSH